MWCRIFALSETAPEPEAIVQHVRSYGSDAEVKADSDDRGWFHLELATSVGVFLLIDRYFAEEGIRDDLNTWAAWLEENAGAEADRLMQHMISTRQMITMRREDRGRDQPSRDICHDMAVYLACFSDGVYQVDDEGFFDARGKQIVREAV